jgi:hypothetical protein
MNDSNTTKTNGFDDWVNEIRLRLDAGADPLDLAIEMIEREYVEMSRYLRTTQRAKLNRRDGYGRAMLDLRCVAHLRDEREALRAAYDAGVARGDD